MNYGRIRNFTQSESDRFQQLALDYQQTVLQAQEEVENGLIGFEKSRQRLDKVALAVVAAEEGEKIALVQYEAGSADFNRVFAIQSAKFGQQDEAARLQGIVARRWINTYRALGGGWQFNFDHALSAAVQPIP